MTELDQINKALPLDLFPGSKDWTEGSTLERVLWLLTMYESATEEVKRLESDVTDLLYDIHKGNQ
jgi:hypothetical protein